MINIRHDKMAANNALYINTFTSPESITQHVMDLTDSKDSRDSIDPHLQKYLSGYKINGNAKNSARNINGSKLRNDPPSVSNDNGTTMKIVTSIL